MGVSHSDFLHYCASAASRLGLATADIVYLKRALTNPTTPSIIWVRGPRCSGCTEYIVGMVAGSHGTARSEVLVPGSAFMSSPTIWVCESDAELAAAQARKPHAGYVLVVEGGLPESCGACVSGRSLAGPATSVLARAAGGAHAVLNIGSCPGRAVCRHLPGGPDVITISGCLPDPDQVVWAIVQLILGRRVLTDGSGRPAAVAGAPRAPRAPVWAELPSDVPCIGVLSPGELD